MSVKIHGAEHPLKEIVSDDFVFEIPPYQRPYSWTTEHAGELFEDVLTAMRTMPAVSTTRTSLVRSYWRRKSTIAELAVTCCSGWMKR